LRRSEHPTEPEIVWKEREIGKRKIGRNRRMRIEIETEENKNVVICGLLHEIL
jgi:hypothetical protein